MTDPRTTVPPTTPAQRQGSTRITVEPVIEAEDIERFYGLYLDAFGPLRTMAVARHVLHEEEFLDEMVNPLIDKYVAWGADGQAIALATVTRHLSTVPWISPEYFAHHYPEQTERGAVFYLGFILAAPGRQRQRMFSEISRAVISRVAAARGVCGWDVCGFNDQVVGLSRVVEAVSQDISPVQVEVLDTQTYYCGVPEASRNLTKLPRMRQDEA
ncbi:hypothetical protein [Nocardioides marmoribigeumensis]|uniref:N-acetyltransferase domain-containing protein n=1 Tax=Nocardioides marmoribigeumensis TaxID=433649 RepID=A0ABU2BYQ8_9ACTN|nr:hypothetical protein [Nocardioides marmoribigeumensis]MDR7363541.1 hypothetical protein [Nocardioides marmoribigeumensis]